MTRGIKVPVQVSYTGGVLMQEGDEQNRQDLRLALGDNDNDNAFQQDIGLGNRFIFDLRNAGFRSVVLARLFRMFTAFEAQRRFRLVRGSLKWTRGPASGEETLELRYIDLESDEVRTFSRTFSPRTIGGGS